MEEGSTPTPSVGAVSGSAPRAPERSLPPDYVEGDLIAEKYELKRRIGQGGMGAVWVAHNRSLESDVAIKLIGLQMTQPEAAVRLRQEARATAKLRHPGIVRVFDFGETDRGD